jgi:hypothetical protein
LVECSIFDLRTSGCGRVFVSLVFPEMVRRTDHEPGTLEQVFDRGLGVGRRRGLEWQDVEWESESGGDVSIGRAIILRSVSRLLEAYLRTSKAYWGIPYNVTWIMLRVSLESFTPHLYEIKFATEKPTL